MKRQLDKTRPFAVLLAVLLAACGGTDLKITLPEPPDQVQAGDAGDEFFPEEDANVPDEGERDAGDDGRDGGDEATDAGAPDAGPSPQDAGSSEEEDDAGSSADASVVLPEGPTEFELSVIDEMNLARTEPKAYAETYIAPLSGQFSATYFNETIEEMTSMDPVGALVHVDGLWRMAKTHVLTQGPTGKTGHDRADGSSFQDNVYAFSRSFRTAGENIAYGTNTARDIVIQLLVDDGIESRGHRKNMLSSKFTQTGVGFGSHSYYRYECVIDYADGWVDR